MAYTLEELVILIRSCELAPAEAALFIRGWIAEKFDRVQAPRPTTIPCASGLSVLLSPPAVERAARVLSKYVPDRHDLSATDPMDVARHWYMDAVQAALNVPPQSVV